MKTIKGITVELLNKHLSYSGVDMIYDFVKKSATTGTFSDLAIASDYNSPLFCPDSGIVVESDDTEILIGDTVILDFYAVVRKLGGSIETFQDHPEAIYDIVDGKVRIPVKTRSTIENYVYAIFREDKFVQYNNWNIVSLIEEKVSEKVHTVRFDKVSQKYQENDTVNKCKVLYGTYEGMTCIFNPSFLLGQAQQTLVDGKVVYFIQTEYILASYN